MKYKKEIFMVFAVLFTIAVLYTDATDNSEVSKTEKEEAFDEWFCTVIDSAKIDSAFVNIPLEKNSEKRWFMKLMYHAWEKRITKNEFIKLGIEKYPEYKSSFLFIADNFL